MKTKTRRVFAIDNNRTQEYNVQGFAFAEIYNFYIIII